MGVSLLCVAIGGHLVHLMTLHSYTGPAWVGLIRYVEQAVGWVGLSGVLVTRILAHE